MLPMNNVKYRVTISPVASLNYERRGHTTLSIGNNILLVIGGERTDQTVTSCVEIIDINERRIVKEFRIPQALVFHQSVRSFIHNPYTILILGGFNGYTSHQNMGILNYVTQKYHQIHKKGIGKRIDAFSMTYFYRNKHHVLLNCTLEYLLHRNRKESNNKRKKGNVPKKARKKNSNQVHNINNKHKRRTYKLKKKRRAHNNPSKRRFKKEEKEEEEELEEMSNNVGHSYLIFGGWDGLSLRYNHLFEYRVQKNEFKPISPVSSTIPSGRTGHSAVMWNNQELIVFGGNNGKKRLNDLYSFNLRTRTWEKWGEGQVTGRPPEKRSGHSAQLLSNRNKMIVVGGFTGKIVNSGSIIGRSRKNHHVKNESRNVFILGLVSKCWETVIEEEIYSFRRETVNFPEMLTNATLTEKNEDRIFKKQVRRGSSKKHRGREKRTFGDEEEEEEENDGLKFGANTFFVTGGYDIFRRECLNRVFKVSVYDEVSQRCFGLKMLNCREYSNCRVVFDNMYCF